MAKSKGRLVLIRIGDGAVPEVYAVLCGLTAKSLSIGNEEIDVTTADCVAPGGIMWSEVLAGTKRVSVSGSGLFTDETTEKRLNTVAMSADAMAMFEVVVPSLGTFQGRFMVQSLEFTGNNSEGATYALTLASSGAVTFTAA
ncbi:MAG: phage major tail protein, TP901-1 family [Gemmobacter sp.]